MDLSSVFSSKCKRIFALVACSVLEKIGINVKKGKFADLCKFSPSFLVLYYHKTA